MRILGDTVDKYIFFDIGPEPIQAIQDFAELIGLQGKVQAMQQDATIGCWNLLPDLDSRDFIHVDPYLAFERGPSGRSFLDVFLGATAQGVKSMLWYGFNTLEEKGGNGTINFTRNAS